MGFVKTGDPQPILSCYDGDKVVICDLCHKPKVVIALTQDKQELICECSALESDLN